jgi:hypothetical protein
MSTWSRYEVRCCKGSQTLASYIVEVWATSVEDAYRQVKAHEGGYTPLSLVSVG